MLEGPAGDVTRRKIATKHKLHWSDPAFRRRRVEQIRKQNADPRHQERLKQMHARHARNATDTLRIVYHCARFKGKRARAWALVRDGMTVEEFVDACSSNGLDARRDL